jgi:hypothetical protein
MQQKGNQIVDFFIPLGKALPKTDQCETEIIMTHFRGRCYDHKISAIYANVRRKMAFF